MKVTSYKSASCDLEVQKMAQEIALLQKFINENLFQWECCARGGNKTENGGCDITAAENVSNVYVH